jgi:hypothetical protein
MELAWLLHMSSPVQTTESGPVFQNTQICNQSWPCFVEGCVDLRVFFDRQDVHLGGDCRVYHCPNACLDVGSIEVGRSFTFYDNVIRSYVHGATWYTPVQFKPAIRPRTDDRGLILICSQCGVYIPARVGELKKLPLNRNNVIRIRLFLHSKGTGAVLAHS